MGPTYARGPNHRPSRGTGDPFEVLEQVPDAVASGHGSFKVWMTNTTPTGPKQKTDLGNMWG